MKKITVDELDVFKLSGPSYLSESGEPWSHANSIRAAMACLVQAVYALDKDRSMVEMKLSPLAPDWHLPFRYTLVKTLHDEEGSEQIVGAVFKWSRRLSLLRAGAAPKVVVALRGTIPSRDTLKSDLSADLAVLLLQLHTTRRFSVALREVKQAVAQYGPGKVCMAGHSLGAAVCLLVGRTLAEDKRWFIDAHLFNPPFPSLDNLINLKGLAGAVVAASSDKQQQEGGLSTLPHLRDWHPHLYVNIHDPICAPYVAYFQNVDSTLQARSNVRTPSSSSGIRGLVESWFGREARPYHLIPSASLHFVDTASQGFMKAHGMKQWWSQDAKIHSRLVGFAIHRLPTST